MVVQINEEKRQVPSPSRIDYDFFNYCSTCELKYPIILTVPSYKFLVKSSFKTLTTSSVLISVLIQCDAPKTFTCLAFSSTSVFVRAVDMTVAPPSRSRVTTAYLFQQCHLLQARVFR